MHSLNNEGANPISITIINDESQADLYNTVILESNDGNNWFNVYDGGEPQWRMPYSPTGGGGMAGYTKLLIPGANIYSKFIRFRVSNGGSSNTSNLSIKVCY